MEWKATDKIGKYFTVKEALYLPTWGRLANENDGLDAKVKANLIRAFSVMDKIREIFGKPVIVHVAYRPRAYNTLIGGATQSAHIFGIAVDFHIAGITCDEARNILKPKLEELKIRMEDLPGSSWVHIDLRQIPSGSRRFFRP
jgi:uncharacterized protein YcbK (DUF882 family)